MRPCLKSILVIAAVLAPLSCSKYGSPAKGIAETGNVTALTAFNAEISGYCYQKNVEGLSVTFGIEYTDTDLTRNATVLNALEIDGNGRFSVDVENLNPGTEYFYRTFVLYNRAYSFGKLSDSVVKKGRSSSLYADGAPNYAADLCFSIFYTDTGDWYERCFAMPVRAVAGE